MLMHMEGICWQAGRPRSQWSCTQSIAAHFTSCFAGHVSCSGDVCKPCGAGSSHSAWSRCWYRSQPSRQAALRHIVDKRSAFQVPASQSRQGRGGAGLSVGRSSAWTQGWRRWRQRTTRSSTAGDQQRECSGVCKETFRCSALCARDASALESSLQRTGKGARKDLVTLVGESWSWQRYAREHLLRHCGHFRTPRREIVMVAGVLDEGRIDSVPLCQICGVLVSARKDSGPDMTWRCPCFIAWHSGAVGA